MATTSAELRTPPYLPAKTFFGFFDALKETAIPQRIDNSVMSRYSGTVRTQIRTALRFGNLIDDSGIVSNDLRDLIKSRGTATWTDVWSSVFFEMYREVIGDLDLDTGTLQQLKERFRAFGVDGSVLIKAVRFFLTGLEETKSSFSPHFKVRGLSTGVAGNRRKPKARTTNGSSINPPPATDARRTDDTQTVPQGAQRFNLPLKDRPAAVFVLPDDMKQSEWDMLDLYIRSFYSFKSVDAKAPKDNSATDVR